MKPRHYWTPEEEALLRRDYADTLTERLAERLGIPMELVYRKAYRLGLKKSAAFHAGPESGRLKPGSTIGAGNRFQKRAKPWNAGMKGLHIGGEETQFKPGHRPQTWVPVGTEVIDSDGYLKRKVRDDAPKGQARHNWKYVHVILWEEHNGPVPKGHAVAFRNGNRADLRIENLELLSRRELMRRNTIHRYPPALKDAIRANGRLRKTIRRQEKHQEASHEEQD
ncbi:MAG: HNH endonuclease signature motif containing protein [Pseudomonadota bacterium]